MEQTILDRAVPAIIRQGRPAINGFAASANLCAYRGEGNTACFIGKLIADEEYKWEWDADGSVLEEVLAQLPKNHILRQVEPDFLSQCQNAHDNASCVSDFVPKFLDYIMEICTEHNLKFRDSWHA